jgi:hypothetical protein
VGDNAEETAWDWFTRRPTALKHYRAEGILNVRFDLLGEEGKKRLEIGRKRSYLCGENCKKISLAKFGDELTLCVGNMRSDK